MENDRLTMEINRLIMEINRLIMEINRLTLEINHGAWLLGGRVRCHPSGRSQVQIPL